jgi:hypothetical protein
MTRTILIAATLASTVAVAETTSPGLDEANRQADIVAPTSDGVFLCYLQRGYVVDMGQIRPISAALASGDGLPSLGRRTGHDRPTNWRRSADISAGRHSGPTGLAGGLQARRLRSDSERLGARWRPS